MLLVWLVYVGLVFTVGAIYEQVVYKAVENAQPGSDWVETEERFVDNETGHVVTVYYQPKTGERRYVKKRG